MHRKMALRSVLLLLMAFGVFSAVAGSDSGIKGPPHLSGAVASRQTFRLGETIKLDCPIRGVPAPILEWSKDGDSITAGWERFKPTNHGLRIKQVLMDDSGFYTCKGVNGFGSEQVTFEVVIVDPNAKATDPPVSLETEIFGPDEIESEAGWKKSGRSGSAPLLIETSQTPGRIWQLPLESTLRLKCVAQGEPEPHLIWTKDGREIVDDRRIGRWELQVGRLGPEDAGTYACRAVNPFGSMNASFIIQVVDRSSGKPEFVGLYPQNLTVLQGSTARLQCRVTSETSPFLQWLKRLEPVSPFERPIDNDQPDHDGIIVFDGWKYRVLRSGNPAYQAEDGSYLDKLSLNDVGVDHAGVYICVATNSVGYNYRQASVAVFTGAVRPLEEISAAGSLPSAAVIGLPVGAVAVVLLIGWLVYYVRSERAGRSRKALQSGPGGLGGPSSGPMVGGPLPQPQASLASLAHHHHRTHATDLLNKDMSVTAPCLPRDHDQDHHRMTLPGNPSYLPYSSGSYFRRHLLLTPYLGSLHQQEMLLSYQPEIVRMHNVINGRQQSANRPPVGPGAGSLFRDNQHVNNANCHGGTWSNMYRSQPCGRSVDRNPSLSSFPRPDSAESEHAYASVHNMNVNYAAYDYEDVRPNNRRFVQRIDMV